MNRLLFDYEWQHQEGVKGPELKATWASLKICIGDECLSKGYDLDARTVRTCIYVPLYPLAEWIVWNWWSLFFEPEVPWLREQRGYSKRHDFRCVGDGIVMPDIEFLPLGDYVQVCWKPVQHPFQRIEFLGSGQILLHGDELRRTFYDFVKSVCDRLYHEGLTDTWLHQGWAIVCQSMEDPEEMAFCKIVAKLGKDPYSLDMKEEELVIQVAERLPESIRDDFFLLADRNTLQAQMEVFQENLEWIQNRPDEWTSLKPVRSHISGLGGFHGLPWNQGYELAGYVRKAFGVSRNARFSSCEDVAEGLKIPLEQLNRSIRNDAGIFSGVEALVAENKQGSPAFVLKEKKRSENQIFSFFRALCDHLLFPGEPGLVSGVNTERQKRNRAFAAEFLAPADIIVKQLSGKKVAFDEIDEIACTMGVSSYVIHHQICNHQLAVVAGVLGV